MTRRPLSLAVALLAGGCGTKPPPPKPAYYGPTDDLPVLVEKLNANAERLTGLRAEGSFSADIVDPATGKHDSPPRSDVTLLLTPPHNVRLVAKFLLDRVMDVGSNDERYWLILPKQDRMFWGTLAAGPTATAKRLPIRPDALVAVLGTSPLPTDLLQQPAPALRFNNDDDCYVLTWQVRLADRWAVQKEVWYDRPTLQPTRVVLYDEAGRAVLRATLADPKPVDGYDPPFLWATKYDLLFPDTGSTFGLRLSVLERERNGTPKPANFVFPESPGVSKVEALDR